MKKVLFGVLIWILLCSFLSAAEENAPEVRFAMVADNLYACTALPDMGNVAFLVTPAGVILVDSGDNAYHAGDIIKSVAAVTDKPIRYIILTHSHGDHVFGLSAFPDGITVISHENLIKNGENDRQEIAEWLKKAAAGLGELKEKIARTPARRKKELAALKEKLRADEYRFASYSDIKFVIPQLTFREGTLTINLGGESVEIYYHGPAHIDDNLVVYFRKQKTLHTGDIVFNGYHPYIDRRAGSDTANWIVTLEKLQAIGVENVIPGHGAIGGSELLEMQSSYLRELRELVAESIKKGLSLEQMKKLAPLPQWRELGFSDMLPYALEAVYMEMIGR